ncbi:MAG: thiamine diphosphokinase [Alphaproteobacteria bacterium]|nr:thiamine diphosphokinase [Alphaproteobacteria bacterium]
MQRLLKLNRYIDLARYKSVLCLDGDLPEAEFFAESQLPVIAADGATNKLISMNVAPDLVIGDLDSVNHSYLTLLQYERVEDQSLSDFQKALRYMTKHDLMPMIILGVNGGHIDHIINNINIFMQGTNNVFIADDVIGYILDSSNIFSLPLGTKVSIIGIPYCRLSSQGLKWELADFETAFPGQNSCFNRVSDEPVRLKVHEGKALLMVYATEVTDAGLF